MRKEQKKQSTRGKTKLASTNLLHLGLTVTRKEMELAKRYHQNLSATMRYLLQKDLAKIVFDDEFLELVDTVPIVIKKRLEEIRVNAGKRIYSESDLQEIRDAEIVA